MSISILLTACFDASFVGDDPSIRITGDESGVLAIVVKRADPNHSFGEVRATINGVDAGMPQYAAGYDPGWIEGYHESGPTPATASFLVPQQQIIGASVHLEVVDDSSRYVLDAPDLGSRRLPIVVSPLDAPLRPGDLVEVGADGASDDPILAGTVKAIAGDKECFTATFHQDNTFEVPPDLADGPFREGCQAAGLPIAIKLDVWLDVEPPISTCTGPALTCEPISLSLPHVSLDATLVF